jgi:hypothetical protein
MRGINFLMERKASSLLFAFMQILLHKCGEVSQLSDLANKKNLFSFPPPHNLIPGTTRVCTFANSKPSNLISLPKQQLLKLLFLRDFIKYTQFYNNGMQVAEGEMYEKSLKVANVHKRR